MENVPVLNCVFFHWGIFQHPSDCSWSNSQYVIFIPFHCWPSETPKCNTDFIENDFIHAMYLVHFFSNILVAIFIDNYLSDYLFSLTKIRPHFYLLVFLSLRSLMTQVQILFSVERKVQSRKRKKLLTRTLSPPVTLLTNEIYPGAIFHASMKILMVKNICTSRDLNIPLMKRFPYVTSHQNHLESQGDFVKNHVSRLNFLHGGLVGLQ